MTLTPKEQAAATAPPVQQEPQVPAQDPPVTAPPTAQPPEPASQDGPWANDLAQAFPDEATRSQVDAFLRSNVQPYVTRIEDSATPAKELYKAFEDQPRETFVQIATELYDDETAKAIADYLEAIEDEPKAAQAQPASAAERDPEVQRLIDNERERQEKADFDSEFARVKAAHPDLDLDHDLFVPFVAKTGDFDQAVTAYKEYNAAWAAKLAPQSPEGEAAPEAPVTAPPVVGSGTAAGVTAPPTEEKFNSIDEAIDSFFDEQRAASQPAAPPVPTG